MNFFDRYNHLKGYKRRIALGDLEGECYIMKMTPSDFALAFSYYSAKSLVYAPFFFPSFGEISFYDGQWERIQEDFQVLGIHWTTEDFLLKILGKLNDEAPSQFADIITQIEEKME